MEKTDASFIPQKGTIKFAKSGDHVSAKVNLKWTFTDSYKRKQFSTVNISGDKD